MKMVGNDWENSVNGQKSKLIKKVFQIVPKWPKMSQIVPKCPEMSTSDASLSERTYFYLIITIMTIFLIICITLLYTKQFLSFLELVVQFESEVIMKRAISPHRLILAWKTPRWMKKIMFSWFSWWKRESEMRCVLSSIYHKRTRNNCLKMLPVFIQTYEKVNLFLRYESKEKDGRTKNVLK